MGTSFGGEGLLVVAGGASCAATQAWCWRWAGELWVRVQPCGWLWPGAAFETPRRADGSIDRDGPARRSHLDLPAAFAPGSLGSWPCEGGARASLHGNYGRPL